MRRFAYGAGLLGEAAGDRLMARLAGLDPAEAAAAGHALHRLGWAAGRREPPVLWDCVREIAEESYCLGDRTELHRRAASLLYAAGLPVERVAAHLFEAGPGVHSETVYLLQEGAQDALSRDSREFAIRCLRRALREFPAGGEQRGRFLGALAVAERDADPAAMLRHAAQAASLLGSVRERAAALASVPLLSFTCASGPVRDMAESARRILATVDPADPRDVDLGYRLEARVRLAGLGAPGAPAAALARLREVYPEPGQCSPAWRELGAVLTFAGTIDGHLTAGEVGSLARRMLDHEPASNASGYAATTLLIAACTAAEAQEPVTDWLDAAVEAAGRRGDDRRRLRMLSCRALAAQQAGRLADACTDAWDAAELECEALGGNDWLSVLGLVSAAIEVGDPWLTGRALAACAERPQELMPVLRTGRLVLQAAAGAEPDPPDLAAALVESVRTAVEAGWRNPALFPLARWSAPALVRLGAGQAALELIARECDRARAWGTPATLGRTLRVWGTLVHGRYALSLWAESVAVLRDCSNQLELARSLTAHGTGLREAGRPGAEELFTEADKLLDTMGEAWLRFWARPQGRARPETALPGSDRLSATERRVAGLVAEGRTSQEIARELGITRRAVEKCLTGLYRRLGVAGRAGLIPAVRRIAGATVF